MDKGQEEFLNQFVDRFIREQKSNDPSWKPEINMTAADGSVRVEVFIEKAHVTYTRAADGRWSEERRPLG